MRYVFSILMFFIYGGVSAQDAKSLEQAMKNFNAALVKKDTVALRHLLHDKLTYGHSTTWIESKHEVMDDLYNGKLVYKRVEQSPAQIVIDGNTGSARVNAIVDVLMNGQEIQLKLHVLQVWLWKNKSWQLLSRQSIKI